MVQLIFKIQNQNTQPLHQGCASFSLSSWSYSTFFVISHWKKDVDLTFWTPNKCLKNPNYGVNLLVFYLCSDVILFKFIIIYKILWDLVKRSAILQLSSFCSLNNGIWIPAVFAFFFFILSISGSSLLWAPCSHLPSQAPLVKVHMFSGRFLVMLFQSSSIICNWSSVSTSFFHFQISMFVLRVASFWNEISEPLEILGWSISIHFDHIKHTHTHMGIACL